MGLKQGYAYSFPLHPSEVIIFTSESMSPAHDVRVGRPITLLRLFACVINYM